MINIKKAYQYFNDRFNIEKSTNGWYKFINPFDDEAIISGKLKMAVNFNYGWVKCFRTDYTNSIINFIIDFESLSYKEVKNLINTYDEGDLDIIYDNNFIEVNDVTLPNGCFSILDDVVFGERVRNYLQQRNFDCNFLDQRGFKICNIEDSIDNYFGYIIIPFYSQNKLIYYIARDLLGGDRKRYKNPKIELFGVGKGDLLYNVDALSIHSKLYVVEGVFDALTIGNNAIAYLGLTLSPTQISLILNAKNVKELVFIADNGFYNEMKKNAFNFIDFKKVKVINVDDCIGKDVNEIGKNIILEKENTTPYLSYSDYLL